MDLVAVKVGTKYTIESQPIIDGLEYVMKQKMANKEKPMVANICVGGPKFEPIDKAAAALVRAGVTLIASAGNGGFDACERSPARVASVLTVGASTKNDTVPDWSNHGKCMNMYGPGDLITSAWKKNDTHYKTVSGTSFAAPLVSGTAAMYLERTPSLSPGAVWRSLFKSSLYGVLKDVQGPRKTNILLNAADLLPRPCKYTRWWGPFICYFERLMFS